jgi:ribonuclease E
MSDSASARPELSGPEPSNQAGASPADHEPPTGGSDQTGASRRRRRGSRGGRNRNRSAGATATAAGPAPAPDDEVVRAPAPAAGHETPAAAPGAKLDAPVPPAVVRPPVAPKPKIGDTRPAPATAARASSGSGDGASDGGADRGKRRRRGGRGSRPAEQQRRPVEAVLVDEPVEVDDETRERRRGRERNGRPVGRYLMVVHKRDVATQIAVLEGRALIEHYVSRPADDATQIDGNIYLGRVQNVLPGMEAAFVDIGTPKNAVLYRGDVRYDREDLEATDADGSDAAPTRGRLSGVARDARIEQLLKTGQTILCQVTKNPIGTKGARLTQEVSLPGRFVVLIPHSDTYGISKRLADDERKRLRRILDEVRPAGHGLIVRTAAEGATADELRRDVARLSQQWDRIDSLAKSARTPALLYREPDMAVRVIREEFNRDYRGVVIDDRALYEEVRDYVASINPEYADRVEWAGDSDDPLPVFERYHVHEQIHKALDRKVWLASGGSLIIERTEALTVIDVNTGKNVGTSNLEETVFRNNLEAAEEIARQLRLRDIGGIIVIDFIDMEISANRAEVVKKFREALARDKTRTQVFDISELGLVEMTRKRISEGLVESFSENCPTCGGRGILFDQSLL